MKYLVEFREKIERVYDIFDTSFIYKDEEIILHKKWNIYFRLPDIKTESEFDYKLLSYCSFYVADNHFKRNSKQCKHIWNRLNRWFRKEFTYDELQKIYCKLGNGCNKKLGVKFIESGLDMNLLNS